MYNVFLVDDEPFILEGMYHILDWASLGLRIVGHANDGAEALEALRETAVDVLVTDISMPKMTGLELIRRLREQGADLKIIVLSGFNDFDYLKEAMHLGIENYLLKPVNAQELRETLRNTTEKLEGPAEAQWSAGDIGVLRDNIMHRWLTNRIAYEELQERARLLGLPVEAPYYMVAICKSSSSAALEDYVRAEFAVPYGDPIRLVVYRDLSGDIVLLFALPDAEGKAAVVRLLERGMDRTTTPDVRIAVGDVREGAEGAGESYAEAQAAFPYFLVRPDRRVLRYESLAAMSMHEVPSFGLEWDRYMKLIHARSREELRELVVADLRRLVAREEATPSFVRQTVIDMLMQIRSEFRLTGQEDSGSLEEEYDRVRHAVDVEDLIRSVVRVADRAMGELEQQTTTPVVKQVLQRIGRSYAEPLSLKSLAQELKIHPVYLGQLFHQETGSTFTEYFNRYRVEKAKQLLVEGRHKVHEIARMVGYPDTRYFYKKFKKYVGVSPMDYRDLQ